MGKFFVAVLCVLSTANALNINVNEYYPTVAGNLSANETMEENINNLKKELVENRDKFDVFVAPEYALTGPITNYKEYAMHIPKIEAEKPDYQQTVLRLANIALEFNKYLIVHLFESATDNNLYSTAVVFNKEGTIIAKHRKISLTATERRYLTPGTNATQVQLLNQVFSVMFGDDLLTSSVPSTSSVIVLSSLGHTLPYENVLSLYSGYALANQKEVLVSGLSYPASGKSGTGVFKGYSNGSLSSESFVSGSNATYNIYFDSTNSVSSRKLKTVLRGLPMDDDLKELHYSNKTDLKTVKRLDAGENKVISTNQFTCSLVSISASANLSTYKFVQQNGKWTVGNSTYSYVFCGLAVAPDSSNSLIGSRYSSGVTINSVKLNLTLNSELKYYPISSDYKLVPLQKLRLTGDELTAESATDVIYLGYLVLTDVSGSYTFTANLLVVFVTLIVARFF